MKHSLESNLRSALEAGDLELHYQPKIDSRTRRVVGLEALARWDHPKLGFVPPATFIPLAEETGTHRSARELGPRRGVSPDRHLVERE